MDNPDDMGKPDIYEPDINEPDINEPDINNKSLEKYHYNASIKSDENEVIFPEEMAEELFNKVSLVGSDEYFENNLNGINFESIIILDDFKDNKDTPQDITKKIFSKKPRKYQNPECQRDRESIECFDCNGMLKISINMITNNASIYLKYKILYQRPERNRVTEEIKNIIQSNLHLMPSDIYRILESNHPEITQKQIHAWWTIFIKKRGRQDSARTEILANFFKILMYLGMDQLICMYMDKDLAQILAKALKKRLADNTLPQRITYSSYDAHSTFNFIALPLLTQNTLSIRRPLLPISDNSLPPLSNCISNNDDNNSLADIATVMDNENSGQLFENYESILQDALLIVQEQREANNVKWAKAVEKSFEGISTMVTDIKKYK
ncbi:14358_t:CDS:2 [Dentiscutata erythropus]|uniref:14358_t:CDS:1 n=1 Tax=Dentiscutata erythropus TaxID=1348616 RepID=A0A9N9J6L9_9GLOM|nr:14358_t:CDS:2 [Dentiscutata erythropus]